MSDLRSLRAPAKQAPWAFVSPYRNSVNRFTSIQLTDLQGLGFQTAPISEALTGALLVSRRKKLLVLNWFEDRVASSHHPWWEFARSLITLTVLRLRVGTIVWFRHNQAPHANSQAAKANRLFVAAICRFVDATVTLRPSPLADYIIPHPDYATDCRDKQPCHTRSDIYVTFGSIRRSRGLESLLQWWPQEKELHILGSCADASLASEIRLLIDNRRLNVVWKDYFVPDDELDNILLSSRYALVSHQDGTSMVSGTFFHAAARGANVLLTPSEFQQFASNNYSFAAPLTEATIRSPPPYVQSEDVVAILTAKNGRDVRQGAWRSMLRSLRFPLNN